MKKFTFVALFCLLFAGLFAQNQETSVADWSRDIYKVGKKYPGYVITSDGDKVQGFIKAGSRCSTNGMGNSNQNFCAFYTNENDKKPTAKYKPKDIKGYMIADKVYESINYSGGLMKKPNFNLIVKDGAIKTYEWYSTVDGFMTISRQTGESDVDYDKRRYSTKIIFAKTPETPMAHSSLLLKFSKKMAALVSENKELATKVTNKEKGYKMLSMFAIIAEYNEWAATK
jgi:hypothetical protein